MVSHWSASKQCVWHGALPRLQPTVRCFLFVFTILEQKKQSASYDPSTGGETAAEGVAMAAAAAAADAPDEEEHALTGSLTLADELISNS
jgi:hypothetical protein